jgi:hypothetical protein
MEDPEVKKMVQQFDKVDQVLGNDDFKKENFGKYAKKYEYQPIVRYPPTDEEEENQRPPYMKLKLDLTWPDSNVKTEVWQSELLDDGKRAREHLNVETVTDFASHVNYMCKFRCVFRPVKMWAHQLQMKDPGYGIVFKLIKIEVEPSKNASSVYQNYLQGNVFIDDEEEAVESNASAKTSTKTDSKASSKSVAKPADSESSDESESSDDSDSDSSDDEPVQKVSSKKGKKSRGKGKKNSA